MIRPRTLTAALVLAAALTGCGADPEPAAAPSASPSPTVAPTTEPAGDARTACHGVTDVKATWEHSTELARVARAASQATDTRIAATGAAMLAVALRVQNGDLVDTDANLALMRAQLDLADACGDLLGDGPW